MSGSTHLEAVPSGTVLSPIEEIVEEMQNGRMVILVDAEDRENEGDLIIPAQMATPDAINFMAKHGRGLVCLTLTQSRAHELRLDFMVRSNGSRNRTAFTQSIEAREGISTWPTWMWSNPSETTSQSVLLGSMPPRLWST